jgi:ADP-ribose pyrophosphatase
MPKKAKAVKPAAKKKIKTPKPKTAKVAEPKKARLEKPKKVKSPKRKAAKAATKPAPAVEGKEQLLSSEVVFEGPLFRVLRDRLIEPGGREGTRDIIRHNGSVVILAVDSARNKKDPWIVIERQYRHAARQFLWELPAGKLDAGEDALAGAKRELQEETGYQAKKWKELVEYYPSPGFLGESMKVFVAEGLVAGDANPEEDEKIEIRLVKLTDAIKMIGKGAILDGKTLTSVLLYARKVAGKRKK